MNGNDDSHCYIEYVDGEEGKKPAKRRACSFVRGGWHLMGGGTTSRHWPRNDENCRGF